MEYKLRISGTGGSGKSNCVILFIQDHFVGDYDPTIEDSYRKAADIDGETCLINILDTADYEHGYGELNDIGILEAVGFILAYSITNRNSFDEVYRYYEAILRVKNEDTVPLVLIGTKCDLEEQREVSTQEGRDLAASWDGAFFETSAVDKTNVEECFFEAVRRVRAEKPPTMIVRNKFFGITFGSKVHYLPSPTKPPRDSIHQVSIPDKMIFVRETEKNMRNSVGSFDAKFVCIDGDCCTHSSVIGAHSNYLRGLLDSVNEKDKDGYKCVSLNIRAVAMERIIDWCYLGINCHLTYGRDIKELNLLELANDFGLLFLLEACQKLLIQGETIELDTLKQDLPMIKKEAQERANPPPSVTPQETVDSIHIPENSRIAETFLSILWRDRKHTGDITLVTDSGEEKLAHSVVLMERSPLFKGMLSTEYGFLESKQTRIPCPDISVESLEAFLKYLYTFDESVVTGNNVIELLQQCDMHSIEDRLKLACIKFLTDSIMDDPVGNMGVLQWAEIIEDDQLLDTVISCVVYAEHAELLSMGRRLLERYIQRKSGGKVSEKVLTKFRAAISKYDDMYQSHIRRISEKFNSGFLRGYENEPTIVKPMPRKMPFYKYIEEDNTK